MPFAVDPPQALDSFVQQNTATAQQVIDKDSAIDQMELEIDQHTIELIAMMQPAAVDLRLPTGNEEDLLGTGGVQAKMLLIASTEPGRVAQHLNIGYTVAQGHVAGSPLGLPASADAGGNMKYLVPGPAMAPNNEK